jgi:distribution and morphology protein 12
MSFNINWELLKTGEEAFKLKDYLNLRFSDIQRPSFLGKVSVINLDFGSIPPEVSVITITDPMEEFYIEEEPSEEDDFSQNTTSELSGFSNSLLKLERSEMDAQVELSITYKGDLSLSISTELIVNQPTPNFLTLPLILTVTKTSLKGSLYLISDCCDSVYARPR